LRPRLKFSNINKSFFIFNLSGEFMNQFKLVSACLAVSAAAFVLPAQAQSVLGQSVSGQGTWESTLLGRDINRNAVDATSASAVYLYDTTLNVTWLRNANAGAGTIYDDAYSATDGKMTWASAAAWAANLTTGSGTSAVSDWRLPTMTVANPNPTYSGDGSTDSGLNVPGGSSEMASLFFNTLGNKSFEDTSGMSQGGYGLTNEGSFQNMLSGFYWLGTEYIPATSPNTGTAWYFNTNFGLQGEYPESRQLYALAVRPGDVHVASVPEPETYAMMLAGLAMVGALSRRRSRVSRSLSL